MYLITQLSKKTGMSIHQIRKYAESKVLKSKKGTNKKGEDFQYYDNESVEIIEIILACQSIGLHESEIVSFIKGWYGNKMSHTKRVELLSNYMHQLDLKMHQLKEMKHKCELLKNEIEKFI